MAKQPLVVKTIRLPKGLDKEIQALSGMQFSQFMRVLAEAAVEKLRREAKEAAAERAANQEENS